MPCPLALILFMRLPEAGRVKTRLIPALGAGGAARLYERLLRRALAVTFDAARADGAVRVIVFYTPSGRGPEARRLFAGPWEFVAQSGAHLGERMENAARWAFSAGFGGVVIVGSDIADMMPGDLGAAFSAVRGGRAALGPAADGGFYLVGLPRECPAIFAPPEWSTAGVCSRALAAMEGAGLSVAHLPMRHDIDTPDDFAHVEASPVLSARLSVVVPTIAPLPRLAPFLSEVSAGLWPGDEIVVARGVEGACPEGVREVSEGVRVVFSPIGRGAQQNAGARAAKGDVLLFLHADTHPPPQFAWRTRSILETPGASLGCFRLAFEPETRALRLIAAWANLRTRLFGLPYGDQGLFCARETFERAGGFGRALLMEDVDLVKKMRRLGGLLVSPEAVKTSPARYLAHGVIRASLRNHATMLCYMLGAPERVLFRFYHGRDAPAGVTEGPCLRP